MTFDTERVRRVGPRPVHFRDLTVARTEMIAAHMVRITFVGDELQDYVGESPDDHVKIAFPQPGLDAPVLPGLVDGKPRMPEGIARPPMRDYTPRAYRPERGELDIDFVIHGDGPASTWAEQAGPGMHVGIAGPRGSWIASDLFDWYLLAGDETAIPAIVGRLEQLPDGTKVTAFIEVNDEKDHVELPDRPGQEVTWLHRMGQTAGTTTLLEDAVAAIGIPDGEGYCWGACERSVIKRIHARWLAEGQNTDWIYVSGYWTMNTPADEVK